VPRSSWRSRVVTADGEVVRASDDENPDLFWAGAAGPSGHQVKGPKGRRAWYALWRDADRRHQRRLGPAHVRDSGRRTRRGAVVWRAGNGPKPDPTYLTPAEAQAALEQLLTTAVREPTDPRRKRAQDHRFGEACDAWLPYVAHEKDRRPSTIGDYRNTVRRYLLPEFRADTLLHTIDTARVDAYRERLLVEGRLSCRTIQKILVLLHGILKRARRKGWIAVKPAADAERVMVRRTGDFNVLSPEVVHAVALAETSELFAAIYATAAFTGLRMGELRALRWSDVDFAKRLVHVRRSFTADAFGAPKSQRFRSVPMSDPVAGVLDGLSRRQPGTRPDDLVFSPGFNVPFHHDTVRKRFYVALEKAGLGGCVVRRTRSSSTPTPHVRHACRSGVPALGRQSDDGARRDLDDDDLRAPRPADRCGRAPLGATRGGRRPGRRAKRAAHSDRPLTVWMVTRGSATGSPRWAGRSGSPARPAPARPSSRTSRSTPSRSATPLRNGSVAS
jgi:integrase